MDQFKIYDSLNSSRRTYKPRDKDLIDYYTLKQFESKFMIEQEIRQIENIYKQMRTNPIGGLQSLESQASTTKKNNKSNNNGWDNSLA
jgi:hypothetical protein